MTQSSVGDFARSTKGASLVPAVDRSIRILNILKKGNQEYGISELSRILDANKGTVREILLTLEYHGLVERNEETKKYRMGHAMLEYGRAVMRNIDRPQVFRRHITRLMELSGETALVSILDGNSTIITDCVMPDKDLRMSAPVGRRVPAIAGSMGKVLLAYVEDDELEEILANKELGKFTDKSVVDKNTFRAILRQVREQGYAVDDEEFIEGVRGVSAPIVDHRGKVIAAVSVIGFSIRMSDDRMPEMIGQAKAIADQISAYLGAPADLTLAELIGIASR